MNIDWVVDLETATLQLKGIEYTTTPPCPPQNTELQTSILSHHPAKYLNVSIDIPMCVLSARV